MSAITVELPYPPSVNHYWRRVGARTLISVGGRRFRKRVCAILKDRVDRALSGPVRVQVDVHPPDRRRRDLDNIQKSLLDALEHAGVFLDDSQIVDLHVTRCCIKAGGKVVVRVEGAR